MLKIQLTVAFKMVSHLEAVVSTNIRRLRSRKYYMNETVSYFNVSRLMYCQDKFFSSFFTWLSAKPYKLACLTIFLSKGEEMQGYVFDPATMQGHVKQ